MNVNKYIQAPFAQMFFIVSLLCCSLLNAQREDTLLLEQVNITANRLQNFSSGSKIQTIDSASLQRYASANLSDLLSAESGIFIKSYGLGGMATSSFRGAGASQTITLWNGFSLNSVMNGQLDLALIPLTFSSTVSIQYGGAGALWGSGAMGGAIHINQQPLFSKGISAGVNFTAGSFKNFNEQFFVEVSKKRWVSSVKFIRSSAKNNFDYYNTYLSGNPLQQQTNAERKCNGVLFENAFRVRENEQLNVVFWYQINDRNIPPTMLQGVVNDNQKDESYRATAEYRLKKRKTHFFVRSAYFDERFNYNGAHSRSQTVINEAEFKIKVTSHLMNVGVNNTYAQAVAESYNGTAVQNKAALFASFRFNAKNKKAVLTISGRQEMVNGKVVPFTYSGGGEIKIFEWCLFKVNASKLYRIPTLNDLYWNPGGNLSLLPEEGFSEDVSLKFNWCSKNEKRIFSFEPGVFNRNTINQIIWLPGTSFWTPQNMMQVWSRGVETNSKFKIQLPFRSSTDSKFKIDISALTNYVLATNEQSKADGDASVGKQLIYTPRYSANVKIGVEFIGFYLAYSHTYTGYRYTATDNSQFLLPYDLANFYLSKKIEMKRFNISVFTSVENLFNTQYQVVLSRAMPMRYYTFGCSLKFNYIKNEN